MSVMAPEQSDLLSRDPVGMTQREMLLRLDARMETFEKRVRVLEDEALSARVERRTVLTLVTGLRSTILVAAAVGPIIAGVIAVLIAPTL